jgi:hypothetical protein
MRDHRRRTADPRVRDIGRSKVIDRCACMASRARVRSVFMPLRGTATVASDAVETFDPVACSTAASCGALRCVRGKVIVDEMLKRPRGKIAPMPCLGRKIQPAHCESGRSGARLAGHSFAASSILRVVQGTAREQGAEAVGVCPGLQGRFDDAGFGVLKGN